MTFKSRNIIFLIFICISACNTGSVSDNLNNETEKSNFYVYGTSFYSSIVDITVHSNENCKVIYNEDFESFTDEQKEEVLKKCTDSLIAAGTGTFITSDGYIITNQHVTIGGVYFEIYTYAEYDIEKDIFIDPTTGERIQILEAELVASSQCNDISLLKVNSDKEFNHLDWYGDDFKPGLEVYTLGYPGIAEGNIAVTTGVISYLDSNGNTAWTAPGYETFAHTSPIFSGNSGGPVVSAEGKIVGINNMTYQAPGEAFPVTNAINNDYVEFIVNEYLIKGINYMDIGMESKATDMWWFLNEGDDRSFTLHFIETLQPNGIADVGGLNEGDLLIEVNNERIGEFEYSHQFCEVLKEWENSDNNSIDYIAYSCSDSLFYKGTFNKDKSSSSIENGIGNRYLNEFTSDDFNLVCDKFLDFYYGS